VAPLNASTSGVLTASNLAYDIVSKADRTEEDQHPVSRPGVVVYRVEDFFFSEDLGLVACVDVL
jgi:hypothetical protein